MISLFLNPFYKFEYHPLTAACVSDQPLQTVQRYGVYSDVNVTAHYKEPLK